MNLYICPSCGAEVIFKSRFTSYTVCSFCQSLLMRSDDQLHFDGTMALLPSDMSVVQIGTKGTFLQTPFEVIGRLKVAWNEGSWNEWLTLEETGAQGWLAEAMGFYIYTHEISFPKDFPNLKELDIGSEIMLQNLTFKVSDIKEVVCAGGEGELPFQVLEGLEGLSIDLRTASEDFSCIEVFNGSGRIFIGRYVDFDDLNLSNLRVIDGW